MENSEFNFFQNWYPISPIEDLRLDRPTPITILGQRLVVWKPPGSEGFRAFRDRCPHRLAPLSEGRIDEKTGHLMCSYHGWQFDADGICTRIPQADNPEIVSTQKDNFCATVFPTREANDLLWVWPDLDSADLAAEKSLPLSPQIDASKGFVWSSLVRDLEYDWQTLIENIVDPSHVPFAHHGVQGDRNRASAMPMTVLETGRDRIVVESNGGFGNSIITFTPPCHVEYAITLGADKHFGLVTYCIPVGPGKSRVVAQFTRDFATQIVRWTPRWWNHLYVRHRVLDGDMILLHHQERDLQEQLLTETWKTAYTMPAQADRMVIEFRRWLDRYIPQGVPWGTLGPSLGVAYSDRKQILDRYHQHTVHCESCRTMLKIVRRAQIGLQVVAVLLFATAAILPDAERSQFGLPLAVAAIVSLGGYGWLKYAFEPKFYFVDYVHAER